MNESNWSKRRKKMTRQEGRGREGKGGKLGGTGGRAPLVAQMWPAEVVAEHVALLNASKARKAKSFRTQRTKAGKSFLFEFLAQKNP